MIYHQSVTWTVRVHRRVVKDLEKLPVHVEVLFKALVRDLMNDGPLQSEWPNYSKLTHGRYHCHLNYSYVVVWEVVDKQMRVLEVIYVGSRENAPY